MNHVQGRATKPLLVVIPTYNEAENIQDMIEVVLALPLPSEILIVDDSSPDGTASIVKMLQREYPTRLHLLQREQKDGLGRAYIAGFTWALKQNKYGYIAEMDADFSHNPSDLPRLYHACHEEQKPLAIGSRYKGGFRVKNWPLGRVLISYCASLYVRMITFMPVRDATAGFVCYRAQVLQDILEYPIHMRGYGFQIEMKYMAYKLGYTPHEVEITFTDRVKGESKMSGGIFSEAFWGVPRMRCRVPRMLKRGKGK